MHPGEWNIPPFPGEWNKKYQEKFPFTNQQLKSLTKGYLLESHPRYEKVDLLTKEQVNRWLEMEQAKIIVNTRHITLPKLEIKPATKKPELITQPLERWMQK
jgi:hypothetical protein